jgi:glycosyltransferase involved in cell wall biosynthesis
MGASPGTATLAIVIPICNESAGLDALFRRLLATFERLPDLEVQVIYVNDGSTDGSLEIMLEQCRRDRRFAVIDLSRNFGQQAAIAAGLAAADADATVVMDGDLQDPPEVIPAMVAAWRAGAEVVRAERRTRQEHGLRRWAFDAFHGLFGWLADFPMPANVGVYGLLDRKALDELNRLPEKNRFLPGLRGLGRLRSARGLLRPRRARRRAAAADVRPAAALRARRRVQLLVQAAAADGVCRQHHLRDGLRARVEVRDQAPHPPARHASVR